MIYFSTLMFGVGVKNIYILTTTTNTMKPILHRSTNFWMLLLLYRSRLIVYSNDQICTLFIEWQSLERIREMMSFTEYSGGTFNDRMFQKKSEFKCIKWFLSASVKSLFSKSGGLLNTDLSVWIS